MTFVTRKGLPDFILGIALDSCACSVYVRNCWHPRPFSGDFCVFTFALFWKRSCALFWHL